jgi:hypothetical protein
MSLFYVGALLGILSQAVIPCVRANEAMSGVARIEVATFNPRVTTDAPGWGMDGAGNLYTLEQVQQRNRLTIALRSQERNSRSHYIV